MALRIVLFACLFVLSACTPDVTVDDAETIECEPGARGPRGLQGPPGPAVEKYVVDADKVCQPGEHIVTVLALCEDGDAAIAGGCSWGEVEDPHDMPLRPLVDAPTDEGDGWVCEGQNSGVGESLKPVTASVVCLAL